MKTLAILLLLCCVSLLAADGPFRTKFLKVPEDDPIQPTLNAWKEKVTKRYAETCYSRPAFGSWSEIPSDSLKTLFPEHRFFTIHWNEMPIEEGKDDKLVSRAYGLYVTLACRKDKAEWIEIFGFGNYEEYGRLLAQENVILSTEEQARVIWEGFCDLHQKHWKDQGIERKDDTIWHLGVITIRDFHYYYRVNVDELGKVISGKLHADKIESKGEQGGADQPAAAAESKAKGGGKTLNQNLRSAPSSES
jgi:hypothetical protein